MKVSDACAKLCSLQCSGLHLCSALNSYTQPTDSTDITTERQPFASQNGEKMRHALIINNGVAEPKGDMR
jgi:hypothetical protein